MCLRYCLHERGEFLGIISNRFELLHDAGNLALRDVSIPPLFSRPFNREPGAIWLDAQLKLNAVA